MEWQWKCTNKSKKGHKIRMNIKINIKTRIQIEMIMEIRMK